MGTLIASLVLLTRNSLTWPADVPPSALESSSSPSSLSLPHSWERPVPLCVGMDGYVRLLVSLYT